MFINLKHIRGYSRSNQSINQSVDTIMMSIGIVDIHEIIYFYKEIQYRVDFNFKNF